MLWLRAILFGVCCALISSQGFAEDFPYRAQYPDVPVIELKDLKTGYDDGSIVIVDVRSAIEFETIHPKGALHVTLSNANFENNLKIVAEENAGKKLALYCNGITCLKSYNATQKAMDAGMDNVYAFDAGIPAWANAYPSETLLVGKPIVNPAEQLIPKSKFEEKTVDFEAFANMAQDQTHR